MKSGNTQRAVMLYSVINMLIIKEAGARNEGSGKGIPNVFVGWLEGGLSA